MSPLPGAAIYVGWDFRDRSVVFNPGSSIYFSDLRNASLEGLNLTGIQLIGCRLNGARFYQSNLRKATFEVCFALAQESPVDFGKCALEGARFMDCHLYHAGMDNQPGLESWPRTLVESASLTLASTHDLRYKGVAELRLISDCRALPIFASILVDDEWEVQAEAIRGIADLRRCIKPRWRQSLMKLLFLRLGAENSVLREIAVEQLSILRPAKGILREILDLIGEEDEDLRLTGLRAAYALCKVDDHYAALVSSDKVDKALASKRVDVHLEAERVLGLINESGKKLEK